MSTSTRLSRWVRGRLRLGRKQLQAHILGLTLHWLVRHNEQWQSIPDTASMIYKGTRSVLGPWFSGLRAEATVIHDKLLSRSPSSRNSRRLQPN